MSKGYVWSLIGIFAVAIAIEAGVFGTLLYWAVVGISVPFGLLMMLNVFFGRSGGGSPRDPGSTGSSNWDAE